MAEKLECFGTANMSDACSQCPDNDECCTETIKREKKSEKKVLSNVESLRNKAKTSWEIQRLIQNADDVACEHSDDNGDKYLKVTDEKWVRLKDVLMVLGGDEKHE